jgi:hypothetical protein
MNEPETEHRVVQAPTYCTITEVEMKHGKPSSYLEGALLSAPTLEDLTKLVHDAMAALGKLTLSEADDFPDQDRTDMAAALGKRRVLLCPDTDD